MEKEPLTLTHPLVQATKAKWDAKENSKSSKAANTCSFEKFFEYFKADCVRFSAIAREEEITYDRVSLIYETYFQELFEDRTGRERWKACTLEGHLVKLKQSEREVFSDPSIKKVIDSARAAGCTVEGVPNKADNVSLLSMRVGALLVNGHLCGLHRITSAYTPNGTNFRFYGRAGFRRSKLPDTKAQIFYLRAEGFAEKLFVVPSELIIKNLPPSSSRYHYLYLPYEPFPSYRNIKTKIDYWQYENAWHVLSPQIKPAA